MSRLVTVGASLGGVAALNELTAALPAGFPAPVLIVLHIGEHPSTLPSILSARCPLPVSHAIDEEPIRDGHVYVAPPDQHMLVLDDRIVLTRGPKEHHTRPAVDPLFRSAALARGGDVIGVVLTGGLDDGTAGLQAIKQAGGVAVVQEPADARAPSMPESALTYVDVDHCLPLALIPRLLVSLTAVPTRQTLRGVDARAAHEQEIHLMKGDPMDHLQAIGSPSTFACPDCHGTLWAIDGSKPQRYRCHTGHGFTARTLNETMANASDEAAWSMLRAMQERERLLLEMAERIRSDGDLASVERLETAARKLREQVGAVRSLLEWTPDPVE
jgi:two-component system, chemotaxis family, protein-glutamate methylesterase/glutaminase